MTVLDVLRARAEGEPDRTAYSYLGPDQQVSTKLTYAEVDLKSRAVSAALGDITGQRVLLLFPSGLDFITAFFGCLSAGAIAVPAYAFNGRRMARSLQRLEGIVDDAQPRLGLTTAAVMATIGQLALTHPFLSRVSWLAVDAMDADGSSSRDRGIDPKALAIIQYTSGSVSAPKGVCLSHENLCANAEMLKAAHGYGADTTFVGWLPLAHDWGLSSSVVQPTYVGSHSVLLATDSFLRQPSRWLRAISDYPDVISGGPNFAYELCVSHVPDDERASLALKSWTRAGIGAEPVRQTTLRRFAAAFESVGFSGNAFYAAYGLAEATLNVTVSARPPRSLWVDRASLSQGLVVHANGAISVELVGCGVANPSSRIAIVDPETGKLLDDGHVGEIWVAGPQVGRGYWQRPSETAATFGAALPGHPRADFLRTGDLGFIDGGELFVTGRLKDLIIIRGRNLYPNDLELSAERHSARAIATVAFAVESNGEERLIVVQESRTRDDDERREIARSIRRAISLEHDVLAHSVIMVKPGSIPKTSSGKLQRNACRELLLGGRLTVLLEDTIEGPAVDDHGHDAEAQSLTTTESKLLELWTHTLDRPTVRIDDRFVDIADSITATRFLNRVCETFEVDISIDMIFSQLATMALLAQFLDEALSS